MCHNPLFRYPFVVMKKKNKKKKHLVYCPVSYVLLFQVPPRISHFQNHGDRQRLRLSKFSTDGGRRQGRRFLPRRSRARLEVLQRRHFKKGNGERNQRPAGKYIYFRLKPTLPKFTLLSLPITRLHSIFISSTKTSWNTTSAPFPTAWSPETP